MRSPYLLHPAARPLAERFAGSRFNVRDFAISSDGEEAYFSAQSPMGDYSVIMKIEKKHIPKQYENTQGDKIA